MEKLANISVFESLQNQANQNMMTQGMTSMSVFNVTDQLKSDFFQFLDKLPVNDDIWPAIRDKVKEMAVNHREDFDNRYMGKIAKEIAAMTDEWYSHNWEKFRGMTYKMPNIISKLRDFGTNLADAEYMNRGNAFDGDAYDREIPRWAMQYLLTGKDRSLDDDDKFMIDTWLGGFHRCIGDIVVVDNDPPDNYYETDFGPARDVVRVRLYFMSDKEYFARRRQQKGGRFCGRNC